MQVGYKEAVEVFEKLRVRKAPSLHPFYINADSKRCGELESVFFVYRDSGEVYYTGFHKAAVEGTAFSDIQSAYGYGGPVSTTEDEGFIKNAWSAYLEWCGENNILDEFVRFHPWLENWKYYRGEVVYDRQTVWVDLLNDDHLATYNTRVRTAVRKAIKSGLRVEWDSAKRFAGDFKSIYRDSMVKLNADKFYFFDDKYFDEILGWKNASLAVCTYEGRPVSAAIFLVEGELMEYHLSASDAEGKRLSATNLILHEAALLGQHLGCKALHMGGGTDNKVDNPLFFFKAGFSVERSSFKIGKFIHKVDAYKTMLAEWEQTHGKVSNRVQFYRIKE